MSNWERAQKLLEEVGGQCNCENLACAKLGNHDEAGCPRPAGAVKALYIGSLCDLCAKYMPKQYLLPPHGSAKR